MTTIEVTTTGGRMTTMMTTKTTMTTIATMTTMTTTMMTTKRQSLANFSSSVDHCWKNLLAKELSARLKHHLFQKSHRLCSTA